MTECTIPGVIIRSLKRHDDQRGWLMELFRKDELPDTLLPAMSYVSMTKPAVMRGPHEHKNQTDYFCFIGPSTFRLYLWDNRPDSPTTGQRYCCDCGEANPTAAIVPPGVVHAYENIGSVEGIVYNAPDKLFAGEQRNEPVDEIRHEDDPTGKFRIDDFDI
ncbi:MAG: dTDP-4-dehydrorhamnose 3,5-epimerase family protein [Candidatus Zixiibacteriota bacterium]